MRWEKMRKWYKKTVKAVWKKMPRLVWKAVVQVILEAFF